MFGCCCGKENKLPAAIEKLMNEAVCERAFKRPAITVYTSGGTAAFFRLTPVEDENAHEEWLGKDLSRAFDELEFYEEARELLRKSRRDQRISGILEATIEYIGVLKDFPCRFSDWDTRPINLLVMRSLLENQSQPRLLDLKIGSKTADANWKGKSRVGAYKQDVLDNYTNSVYESVRLEGLMNPPAWVESEDPLKDFGGNWMGKGPARMAQRIAFQRKSIAEAFNIIFDLHGPQEPDEPQNLDKWMTSTEYAELLLIFVVRELARIYSACLEFPVPQKWIGSSLAIVIETKSTLQRNKLQSAGGDAVSLVSDKARVKLFDWGRSELNTIAKHKLLEESEQLDRDLFWRQYQEGIGGLFFEATRYYYNTFCATAWSKLHVTVLDYDSSKKNDFLGTAEVKLPPVEQVIETSFDLQNKEGKPALGRDGRPSKIALSIRFSKFPAPSRLLGAWRVHVKSGDNLVVGDVVSNSSDALAVVTLTEGNQSTRSVCARTSVVERSLNPVWDEVLQFPVALLASGGDAEPSITALLEALKHAGAQDSNRLSGSGNTIGSDVMDAIESTLAPPPALGGDVRKIRDDSCTTFLREMDAMWRSLSTEIRFSKQLSTVSHQSSFAADAATLSKRPSTLHSSSFELDAVRLADRVAAVPKFRGN